MHWYAKMFCFPSISGFWIQVFFSHNHASVENGCISNVTVLFLSFIRWFSTKKPWLWEYPGIPNPFVLRFENGNRLHHHRRSFSAGWGDLGEGRDVSVDWMTGGFTDFMATKQVMEWKFDYWWYTSSTAQGGGGSFKNRKSIGEIACCESWMSEQKHWPTD